MKKLFWAGRDNLLISDVPDFHSRRGDVVTGDHHAVVHRSTAAAVGGDHTSSVRVEAIRIQTDRDRTGGGNEGGHGVLVIG